MLAGDVTVKGPAETPSPYAASVAWGRADLDVPGWPADAGPRQFRGALLHALMPALPGGWHSDWNGRDNDDGDTLHRRPPILYRVHGGHPSVYAIGPLAHQHIAALGRHLRALHGPDGTVYGVDGVALTMQTDTVKVLPGDFRRYRLRAPLYPPMAAYRRRPRQDRAPSVWPGPGAAGPERAAWAGWVLVSSVTSWLVTAGVDVFAKHPLSIQVLEYRDRPGLTWERASRDIREVRTGFDATFTANVALPPGIGLGARCSEGYGEVEPC